MNNDYINKLNIEDLCDALDVKCNGIEYFFNKISGDIIPLSRDFDPKELYNEVHYNFNRQYIKIEPLDLNELFSMIKKFTDSIENKTAKRKIKKLIIEQKKLSEYKKILVEYPELRDKWLKYKWNILHKKANKWIKKHM